MTTPNPLLKKLGLSTNDRAVIFHADDISMSQASLSAYIDLAHGDTMTSAAAMVPCPWFPATAHFIRENQEKLQLDVGVHLTLTSEWDHYRWGPISTTDPATGRFHQSQGRVGSDRRVQFRRAHGAGVLRAPNSSSKPARETQTVTEHPKPATIEHLKTGHLG